MVEIRDNYYPQAGSRPFKLQLTDFSKAETMRQFSDFVP